MPPLTDTPPEIAAMVRQRLMERSGAERFQMGCRMFEAARDMVLASLPKNLTDQKRKELLFERFTGCPFLREGSERLATRRNLLRGQRNRVPWKFPEGRDAAPSASVE